MRSLLFALALISALFLSACNAVLPSPPTPEPFVVPPTPTPKAETTATVAPSATAAGESTQPTAAPDAATTPTAVPGQAFTVERGDVVDTLPVPGVVTSLQRQELGFAQGGLLKTLAVEGPGPVTEGQLIAELDLGDLPQQLKDVQATHGREKALLDRALAGSSLPVRRAEIELATAQDALAQAKLPATPEQLAAARASVQSAQAALSRTRNDASAEKGRAELAFETARKALLVAQAEFSAASLAVEESKDPLANQRLIDATAALRAAEEALAQAEITVDTARGNEIAAVQAAEANVATAQAEVDRLLKLPDPFAVKAAERAVQLAQLAVEEARQGVAPNPEISLRVDEAEKAMQAIQKEIDSRRIYAPFAGDLVAIIARPGATLQPNEPVVAILNPAIPADQKEIQVTSVPGDRAGIITAGMPVVITFASNNGKAVNGQVDRVITSNIAGGPVGLAITYDTQSVSVNVGDRAQVLIELARSENTLWLPPQVVQNDGQWYVTVRNGDQEERVDIEVGITAADRIEIVGGLTEGQTVVVAG